MDILHIFMYQMLAVLLMYLLAFFAMGLDLVSGVRKAKERGEVISSKKLRRTFVKMAQYYNILLVVTLMDILQMFIIYLTNEQCSLNLPYIPILTGFATMVVLYVEYKSIREKAEDKVNEELDMGSKAVLEALTILAKDPKNAENILNAVASMNKTDKQ